MTNKKIDTLAGYLAAAQMQEDVKERIRALKELMQACDVETDDGAKAWNRANDEVLRLDIRYHALAIAMDEFCLKGAEDDA